MKVCPWCAEELADEASVCSQCGRDPDTRPEPFARVPSPEVSLGSAPPVRPVGAPPGPASETMVPPERTATNPRAVAAATSVVLSYPASFAAVALALVLQLVGVLVALVALQQLASPSNRERGKELAMAAVALGGLGLLGSVVALARGAALVGASIVR